MIMEKSNSFSKDTKDSKSESNKQPSNNEHMMMSITVNRLGIEVPVLCVNSSNSIKFEEIVKTKLEEIEGVKYYELFVSSLNCNNKNKAISGKDLSAIYEKLPVTKLDKLGILEEITTDGVLDFQSTDKVKEYLDDYMCGCKVDYGTLSLLLHDLSVIHSD